MTDRELDGTFEVLRKDDGEHLGSVRGRVMARIEADARRRRVVTWMSLAAAAVVAIVAFLAIPRSRPIRPALDAAVGSRAAPLRSRFGNAPDVATQRPAPLRSRLGNAPDVATQRPAPLRSRLRYGGGSEKNGTGAAAEKAGPLEVIMQTDDPDVLIIWLVDGDEEAQRKGTL